MDFDSIIEEAKEDVEQYAEQRMQGTSFDEAQAAMELRSAFKNNGVDVDEVRYIGGDPSLMYYYDPADRKTDVVSIALVAAEGAAYIANTLAVTALESESERHAHFRVDRAWIDAYDDGDLSKTAFSKRVLDSWEEY
jgi:hypothetical protein